MSEASDVHNLSPDNETDAIKERREKCKLQNIEYTGTLGLALSGGGIRSATFCLGLVRALAKNGLLKKFDYLSTVSGGGYLGGMLGRLYTKNNEKYSIDKALASDDTILLAWLRNNGRYLTPAGFLDKSLAITQIFRSFIAALFLLTLMCLVVSGIAISLNTMLVLQPNFLETTPWLIALSVPLFFSAVMAFSYWILDEEKPRESLKFALTVVTISYACLAWIIDFPDYFLQSYLPPVALIIIAVTNVKLIHSALKTLSSTSGKLRQQFTRAMTNSLWLAGAILILWGVYALGLLWSRESSASGTLLPPALLALLKASWELTAVKKLFSKMKNGHSFISISLMQGANILGYLLLIFSLITVCAAEIKIIRYDSLFHYTLYPSLFAFAVVLFFIYLCQPKRIITFLNLSSLHNFYRSRIERAWLSVTNVGSPPKHRFPQNPLEDQLNNKLANIEKVTDSLHCDDVQFKDYNPHSHLGPIHLITCCINQTVDDRSGNYNADRKGIALTVSSFGVETGTHFPLPSNVLKDSTLSKWIAISGAAAATGMGSLTSPGLAFILFLIGGRLGFWEKNLNPKDDVTASLPALFAEMFARFPGKNSEYWYLSDGGHFENTGVYPLLKRRVKTIVVADCGADPEYRFDDLENLVRKARIDYGIIITFDTPAQPMFIPLYDLKKGEAAAPLIKATISYPKQGPLPEMQGTLLIVKPHLLENMGLDTERYAKRHDDFPQQTTGDQFFDEEQWEAYHQLGLQAGKAITRNMLS
ncbi:TPA: patatin-like phospholipase family protein [Enterobacter asburiae]|nr:patatin-like phospholipase family protein [Enterobacter asburiae]HDR2802844.1 patatin-like phospholipase family protein [Enterobacter asburiae]HDR2808273.1 patatin-like phospholipase family protein [Enterobacter asburiae]HDR2813710.1 patatin-like phospholipase family protein [Enterobacter asburiae]